MRRLEPLLAFWRSPALGRQAASAFALGAASVFAFAPAGLFPLIWLTLAGLYALLVRQADATDAGGMKRGALIGGAFGFGYFLAGVSWVYVSLSVFGNMAPMLAALATILFCAYLALFPALAGALFLRWAPTGALRRSLVFAALWMLAEWLRGWLLSGFPWLASGYSQTPPSPLAGFAPIFGVYGLSFLAALVAACGVEAARHLRTTRGDAWRARLGAPLLAVLALGIGGLGLRAATWTTPVGERLSVALLQGNIAQDLKWRPEKLFESLTLYFRLAYRNPAQLTVLPETALPAFLNQIPPVYLADLEKLAARENGDILFGVPVADPDGYRNAAVSLGAGGEQRYAKSHLVPFGEFTPPGFAWFMALAKIPMSDFAPGPTDQRPLELAGRKVAINICYEDIFGEEIIRALPEAELLVNISNVAWFGRSWAPAQHLQIAQIRALESGRMMLRSTNTGMTAIVDRDGRVASVLQPFTRGALRGQVQAYAGSTPFVRWGNWAAVLGALAIIFALKRRPQRAPAPATTTTGE